MPLSPEQLLALNESAEVLETEANQLAHYLEFTLKTKVSLEGQLRTINDLTPHRVAIAIRNEIQRLRAMANSLRHLSKTESID